MALDSKTMAATYPIPTYRFTVTVGKEQMAFSSVSGLEQSVEKIEYKDGLGGLYQMPGQAQSVTLTLKRGVMPKNSQLYDWMSSISLNRVEKKDISISLTDESGKELLVTWNVSNAFPTKLTAPSLDATSNEVAFEELSLAADRVTVNFH
ncbi:phage tail protein [Mycetohabitans sp. B5]|uniref:Phage tail-like protein n=1 Tax=Mycetohabitans endofungorum TaxID=417203 RepID=A0A2P5KAV6_9BURK|nr:MULTISPECIES: phage tail protein [Mycetohabitans]MCG1054785.1 phage tail protein [Mycetohabitans sp. B5]PPB83843.1 phage tail-like protein [Mycetohabitans endofungorum]